MILSDSGLSKAIKEAYKSGGYTLDGDSEYLRIITKEWYVSARWEDVPKKVLATITEHIGLLHIGDLPLCIRKGRVPQSVMPDIIGDEIHTWIPDEATPEAHMTNVYIGDLKLYQTEESKVYGFSQVHLGIMDPEFADKSPEISAIPNCDAGRGIWRMDVYVAIKASRPSDLRSDKPKTIWSALESVDLTLM